MSPPQRPSTVREAAEVLNLAEATVREHIRTGRITAVRIGRTWRIPAAEMARLTGAGAA